MKNYYDQQLELELAKNRLATLKEKKELYFEETQPKSKKINGVMVQSSIVDNNKFLEYTAKIEYLDDEIDVLDALTILAPDGAFSNFNVALVVTLAIVTVNAPLL